MAQSIIKAGAKNPGLLSSGLTLQNLACTGTPDASYKQGHIYRYLGRSSSGKTFLTRMALAEACKNKAFDKHLLIYDDVERGAQMNTRKFFGDALYNRMEAPNYTKGGRELYSQDIVQFYKQVLALLDAGKSLIWVEDSLDALDAMDITKMGDGKAKVHSQYLRKVLDGLEQTKSILFLISQARSGMGKTFGDEDVSAGGLALEHYSTLEFKIRRSEKIKKTTRGKELSIGSWSTMQIKKNRLSGVDRMFRFPLYYSFGVDDIGSMIDFLTTYKHWGAPKKSDKEKEKEENKPITFSDTAEKSLKAVVAPEFDFEGPITQLIWKIEDENSYRDLQLLTAKVWQEVEDAVVPDRKSRYS